MPSFYEFFAGGGMARAGLGPAWKCLFANDNDPKKVAAYKQNWGVHDICERDIEMLSPDDIPATADLAWASFPCQDLSLAGPGAGLKGTRSGTFWQFLRLIDALSSDGRAPRAIVLENVCGALTSHKGEDFRSLFEALRTSRYRAGALVIDAALFLPQSRPRLFVIGIHESTKFDETLVDSQPQQPFHTAALRTAYERLSTDQRSAWVWWRLPPPTRRRLRLADIIEETPENIRWHSVTETSRLLSLMSPSNLHKVEQAKRMNRPMVGTLYRRTRRDESGRALQRAEVRFDDVAGCLRTPNGGSSRQTIVVVNHNNLRSRLLSPRETARLMGLPEQYILPTNYNEAYHLTGDGVAVPVVRHLAQNLIEPLIRDGNVAIDSAA